MAGTPPGQGTKERDATLQIRVAKQKSDDLYKRLVLPNRHRIHNPMKQLLLTLALFSAVFLPSAHAVSGLPYFDSLRTQVLNQLNIATNGVEEPDKKLVSALRKALTTIDKTKVDFASGAKALGTLAKGLNRTTLSNDFAGEFASIAGDYAAGLLVGASTLSNRLASTFPSKAHTAAEGNLAELDAAVSSALSAGDVVAAAKFLSTAAKNLSTAAKNVDKAEDAPAPSAGLTANISGALHGSFNDFNTTITRSGSSIGVNSQTTPSASGFDNIIMELLNVSDGTQTVNLKGAYSQVRVDGRSFGGNAVVNGTATITYNSATQAIFGTFSFVGDEGGSSTATVTVSGSFSGTAL